MSKVRLLAAIAAASVLAVSLFAAPAYAVSSFDDTVELGINEVSFTDSGVFRSKLVTEAVFDELVVNSSDPACQAGYAGYEDADIRGAFQEVSAYTYESMQYSTVTFFWADTSTPENVLTAQDEGGLRYLGLDTNYLTDAGTIVFSFGYVNGSGPLVVADCFNGNDSIMSVPVYDFALNAYGLYASDPTAYHSHWRKPLFLEGDVAYPTGYEGITIPSSYELNPKYVAMGDSFSSGEGNEPFETGTTTDSVNECHRSSQAYPRLLQNDPDLDLGSMAFVACSGAKTSDVLYGGSGEGNWGEGAQTDVLSADTETVTITIGGNDVGFVGYAENCVLSELFPLVTLYQSYGGCGSGTAAYTTVMANINSITFLNKLQLTYDAILENAPNAKVYVVDYPLIFGGQNDPYGCSIADGSGAYAVETALNTTISDAVQAVRNYSSDYADRLVYVNTNESSSPFTHEYLCTEGTDGSAFREVTLVDREYSLHPNVRGHQNFSQILRGYLE